MRRTAPAACAFLSFSCAPSGSARTWPVVPERRLGCLGLAARVLDLLAPGAARAGSPSSLEFVLLVVVVLDEAQLVVADRDHVAVLQRMFLDQLAVDVGAVGAVQVLEERIVEDVDDQRVMARHRRVVDADVVIRQAPHRVTLLVHVVFGHYLAIESQY